MTAKCRPHKCRPLAASTVRQIHAILSGTLAAAERWDWINSNPARSAKRPKQKAPEPDPPSPKEAARLADEGTPGRSTVSSRRSARSSIVILRHYALGATRDGRVVAVETVGDGVEHAFTTHAGEIWVGYFDEGSTANYGWGDVGTAAPLGSCGLMRYSSDLRPDWRFPSHVDNQWGAISDCYALNVADDAVWTCYCTDFRIVGIHAGVLTG